MGDDADDLFSATSRRTVLRAGGAGAVALVGALLLAGCPAPADGEGDDERDDEGGQGFGDQGDDGDQGGDGDQGDDGDGGDQGDDGDQGEGGDDSGEDEGEDDGR